MCRQQFRIVCLSFLLFSLAPGLEAAPNIHFTDYRILLSDKQTTKNYQIFNQGNAPAYCYTGVIDHHVSVDGKLSLAKGNNRPATSAADIVRISPRRVVVPAMSNQKVKVVARRFKQLPEGERVSYLNLRCKEHNPKLTGGLNIQPNFIFNIPIVVRKGDLKVEARLAQASIAQTRGKYVARLKLDRQGERSLFGNLLVYDEKGILAAKNGISHYLQSSSIPLQVQLKHKPRGRVTIEFIEQPQFGGDLHLKQTL